MGHTVHVQACMSVSCAGAAGFRIPRAVRSPSARTEDMTDIVLVMVRFPDGHWSAIVPCLAFSLSRCRRN